MMVVWELCDVSNVVVRKEQKEYVWVGFVGLIV